jgi:hypothetical protein
MSGTRRTVTLVLPPRRSVESYYDAGALDEIALLAEVMAAASTADQPLPQDSLDAILLAADESPEPAEPSSSGS